jgi:hypothetical protein
VIERRNDQTLSSIWWKKIPVLFVTIKSRSKRNPREYGVDKSTTVPLTLPFFSKTNLAKLWKSTGRSIASVLWEAHPHCMIILYKGLVDSVLKYDYLLSYLALQPRFGEGLSEKIFLLYSSKVRPVMGLVCSALVADLRHFLSCA